jgi:hypothetical protein
LPREEGGNNTPDVWRRRAGPDGIKGETPKKKATSTEESNEACKSMFQIERKGNQKERHRKTALDLLRPQLNG